MYTSLQAAKQQPGSLVRVGFFTVAVYSFKQVLCYF
jgi:hypothetical protein